jgi:hypothetical protein
LIQFRPVVDDFTDTLHALREFVASLAPVLLQREKDLLQSAGPLLAKFAAAVLLSDEGSSHWSRFSEEERAKLLEAKKLLCELGKNSQSGRLDLAIPAQNMLPIKFVDGKVEVDWNDPKAAEIIPAKRAMNAVKTELRLLHESALMALTARSEWFIAQLLHLYFRKYPNTAGMSEPFFSLDALMSLPTIDDAKDMLFDHRVELLMRESLEEWLKFFKDKPKLGMGYLVNEIGRISEIFKRRNLVVHNGGRAGRRYFKEVEESFRPGVNLGEIVDVSTTYLKASIDLIEHQFLLLGVELWKHLDPQDDGRGRFLMTASVRSLDEGRWVTARGLSQFGMNDKNLPEFLRLSNQINYWQSFKWAGQYEEIRAEVEKADFSAKAPLYQLAYAAVKDDFESCFKLIPGLLERAELKNPELNSWPLFQNLRKLPQFSVYKLNDASGAKTGDQMAESSTTGKAVN